MGEVSFLCSSRCRALLRDSRYLARIYLVIAKALISSTSEAVDDYLKAILELSGPEEDRVTSNAIAGHLASAPAP